MKNKTDRFILIGILVILAAAGFRALSLRKARHNEVLNASPATPTTSGGQQQREAKNPASQKEMKITVAPGRWAQDPKNPKVLVDRKSEENKTEFLNLAHLDVNLPKDYAYQKLDISEDIAGLRGIDEHNKINFVVLAKRGSANPEEVPAFLRDQGDLIPGFGDKGPAPQLSAAKQLPPSEGSGLVQATYWEVIKGDKVTRVVFANRKDGLGSYLFVVDGNAENLDAQEGRFEDILDNVKAK
jgi:hypothetical protein